MVLIPKNSEQVIIPPIITPKIPCELMFCPVNNRFLIFVLCDTYALDG